MSGYRLQDNETQFTLPTPDKSSTFYISCILTKPEIQMYPSTRRAAILMHGIGAHKNTCYLSKLARKLSKEQGYYVVRFDFRNCGDSSKTGELGRTLQDDLDDLSVVYNWLTNGGVDGKVLYVDTLAGHSRGVVDVFNWQLQNKDKFVINLVACAGRFDGKKLPLSIKKKNPNLEERGYHVIKGFQDGKYQDVVIPLKETMSLGELYMDTVKEITHDTDTLLVYGSDENVIPIEDCASYANALKDRYTLVLIPHADHCFRGLVKIPETEWETCGKPIDKKLGVIDYTYDVANEIASWMTVESLNKRFYEKNINIHKFLPRWKNVEGVYNFRDIGAWSTRDGNTVRFGKIFRCGTLTNVTSKGIEEIQRLGVKHIFDLRLPFETKMSPTPSIPGVSIVPIFCSESDTHSEMMMTAFALPVLKLVFNWANASETYIQFLSKLIPLCKPIFELLRDDKDCSFLFHCSFGKDRTGVLTVVLLMLAGVSPQIIAQEYALSNYGLRDETSAREQLEKVIKSFGASKASVSILEKYISENKPYPEWSMEMEGIDALLSVNCNSILELTAHIQEQYGGVAEYLEQALGLPAADIATVRQHLIEAL